MIIDKLRRSVLPEFGRIARRQGGYTLTELLVGMAITALLLGGLTTSIFQIVTINASSTSRMTAIKQVESAIATMREDIFMAQHITPDTSGGTGFPLVLTWRVWSSGEDNNDMNTITYFLNEDRELVRQLEVEDLDDPYDPGLVTDRVIAQNIDSIVVENLDGYAGGKITLLVTSSLQGFRSASETRAFDIYPRPSLPSSED